MLTITPEAREYALNNGGSLYLEYIVLKSGCCIPYQPEPSVKIGKPVKPDRYREKNTDGVTVFVPHELPDIPLVITLTSFVGFRKLAVEGWRHA